MSSVPRVRAGLDAEGAPPLVPPDDPVVRTRFVPPRLRSSIVARPRVDALLARVIEFPFSVVRAEAGYGKTTAVASWLARTPLPHVWYHVGDAQRDPRTFLLHLVGALQTLHPGLPMPPVLRREAEVPTPHQWRTAVDALSNDLLDALREDTILVLDDYDGINVAEVNEIVDRLVETMPPLLHVVVTARTMPSLRGRVRWRASGEMLEITRADLAFTPDETALLFGSRAGQAISSDAALAIASETEGWPIALQMLANALSGADSEAIDTLLRRIPGPSELLFDYLADEVFLRQSAEHRRFLGESATLRLLDPVACDAILGTSGSEEVLRTLEQQSLFLTRDVAFRYHKLFRDFLLRRSGIGEARRRELHARAADFFMEQAEHEEAVFHLIGAGEGDRAAAVLERIAGALLANGRHQVLDGWLGQLAPATIAASPDLLYARAETHRLSSRYADALPAYEAAVAAFRGAGDPVGEIRALRGEALLYLDTVQPRRAEPLLRLAWRKARGDRADRQALYLLLAENTLNSGDLPRAERMYRALGRESPAATDPRLLVRRGQLADVRAVVEAQRRTEAGPRLRPRAPRSHRELSAMLSWAETMMGDADLARQHAEESLDVGHALGSPTVECIATARLGLAWLVGHDRDLTRARALCLDAIRMADRLGVSRFSVEPLLGLVVADGLEGRVTEALAHAERAREIAIASGDTWVEALICVAAGAAAVPAQQGSAADWLNRARLLANRGGHRLTHCLATLWLAIHRGSSSSAEGRELFATALEVAVNEGYGFLFQGAALFAPRDPGMWRGLLRRAHEHPRVGEPARALTRQLEAASGSLSAGATIDGPSTAALWIQTLGPFRVWLRGNELPRAAWGREKALLVLQYLVGHRRAPVGREQIVDALWPDGTPAARATGLRVALSALRDALSPERETGAESPFLGREGDALRLATENGVRVDADEFVRLLQAARAAEHSDLDTAAGFYEAALALYRGEFLADQRYAPWVEAERQGHRAAFLAAVDRLSALLLRLDEPERAARWAESALAHDPLWEAGYAVLMEAQWRQGNRALALRTYNRCRRRLQSALGVVPSERLASLRARLVGDA